MAEATSFIPKTFPSEPQAKTSRGLGIFLFLGVVLLALVLAAHGSVYFYKSLLTKQIGDLSSSLQATEADFEPPTINKLYSVSASIDAAKTILSGHRSFSRIFGFLEADTLDTVHFASFSFSAKDTILVMAGESKSYTDLSLQAAVFEKNPFVKRVSFSNLSLKDNGSISFSVEITFDPTILSFQ